MPTLAGVPAPPAANPAESSISPTPTAIETRNVGATLEVEPHVSAAGDSIRLNLVPQRVDFLGFDSYDGARTASGVVKLVQPQFFTTKVNSSLTVQSGQRTLLAVHLLTKPEGYMEVFILQAWATPIK